MKKLSSVLWNVFLIVLLAILIFLSISWFKGNILKQEIPSIGGISLMTVLTGSMEPKISPGDIVIVKKEGMTSIKVGDVITFKDNSDSIVTHRVIGIQNKIGNKYFMTKGDYNNVADGDLVDSKSLIGKVIFKIPKIGLIGQYARDFGGLVLLIVLPLVLLLIIGISLISRKSYTKNIKSEDAKK